MSRAVIIVPGLLALALLIFFCVYNHSTAIQADIQNRTSLSLANNPTSWAKVRAYGRNVVLSGTVPSEELRQKAEGIVNSVSGVVSIDNQIKLATTELAVTAHAEAEPEAEAEAEAKAEAESSPIISHTPLDTQFSEPTSDITLVEQDRIQEQQDTFDYLPEDRFGPKTQPILTYSPYNTQFSRTPSGITLRGLVPNEEKRKLLIQLAENKFGIENVNDQFEIGLGAPENWLQITTATINNLALLKEGNANITDTHLDVTGQVINGDTKKTITDNLKSQLSKTATIELDLAIPRLVVAKPVASKDTTSKIPAPSLSCVDQFKQTLADDQVVHFSTNSSELNNQSQKAINKILQYASVCPNSVIEVGGYTDSLGDEAFNLELSKNRAKTIANQLIKSGFPAKMLKVQGYGESNPTSDNKTELGRANNRRIKFRYLQEGE